ncbi:hypothetical protein D9611_009204 [Ephemerocybe angulata]|uniref:DNA replication ATP-dependent helicase/nuclease DNA2 n=1 Tax=Ephemerocybe angulata TaxID=980116 RepID=A0A8H5CDL7_9AGAR|nr:hypothetical protein D9611_009204 [Tulosesus angulatus]
MAPAHPEAEADFMAGLLQGLDASFEPAPLPAKPRPSPFPSRHHVPNAEAGPSTPSTTSRLIDLTNKATTSSSYQTPKKQRIGNTTLQSDNGGPVADVDMDELLAGAEDWDFDDWVPSPKKPSPKKRSSVLLPQPTVKPRAGAEAKAFVPDPYTRCVVDAVGEVEIQGSWFKQLDVRSGKDLKDQQIIYLQNDWYDTDVRPGDIVNAVGPFEHTSSAKPSIKITSQSNLLILHPDILLTATALSNAPQCARKPLLSSLVRASNDISPALVWGNMLHEVMQNCLSEKRWEEEWINEQIEEVLLNGLGMLLALNVSIVTARTELRKRAIGLQIFKERYISDVPKPDAVLSDTRARSSDSAALLAIPQLHEIEEDIWSPKYGLKGKVDATVEAVISETPPAVSNNSAMNKYLTSSSTSKSSSPPSPAITSGPRPFEIKTGRSLAGLEHRAQTMLYTLLASERYGTDVPDGLLYYTQSDTVVRVPRSRNEIRGLIVARNALAGYMIKRVGREGEFNRKRNKDEEERKDIEEIGMGAETFLPPPIDDEHACKRCYTVDTCMLYRYAYSAKTPETKLPMLESPPTASNAPESLVNTYDLKTGHLTPEQGLFFRKWETLLSLEERDLVRFRRELWTIGAEDREKKGRCFAGMVVKPLTGVEQDAEKDEKNAAGSSPAGEGRVYKFSYTFVRSKRWTASSQGPSESDQRNLLNGHLNVGDPITVSVEPHLLAFAQGFITDLTPDAVKLGIDHKVDLEWIRARMRKDGPRFVADEVVFRIDKDELFGGMGRMRNNLAQLFYANGDRKRLELVVDLRKPLFSPSIPPESLAVESSSSQHVKNLNMSQKQAVSKVLSAEDYALVLGMPGTGKTTVISALIKILVAQGKTVLLTSYTHSAVDTILRKLDDEAEDKNGAGLGFGVLRLGNLEKIHPDVRKYTLSARRKAETVEQLEAQWMGPPVVAATCLSVDHSLFNRRRFDYCIVDEASQITLPTCLGPLRYADKFILVGDHFQLPPLVKNPLARRGGLEVSLFRRLSDAHPDSVVDLREQYRMNEDIMALSNKLIYGDRLKCGSVEVANRKLVLPNAPSKGELTWLDASHRRQRALEKKWADQGDKLQVCSGVRDQKSCWLAHLASPETTAVFVDTDSMGPGVAHDSRVGDLVQNEVEAELVVQLVEALVGKWGLKKKDVGVISLYRQQVKLIKSLLLAGKSTGRAVDEEGEEVEVLTADKSQGRDKECVVVSMVRSNDHGQVGELVKDWRRMNVSFTRARSKLVIFGSRKTLKSDPLLAQFFELMEGRGWVYELPVGAHVVHKQDLERDEEDADVEEEVMEEEDVCVVDEVALDVKPVVEDQAVMDQDLTLRQEIEVEMDDVDCTLVESSPVELPVPKGVKQESRKASSSSRKRVVDDDDDVEIVDEFFTEPKPKVKKGAKSKRANKAQADAVIDIEDDDDVMVVDAEPAPPPAKPKKSGFFVRKGDTKGKEKEKEKRLLSPHLPFRGSSTSSSSSKGTSKPVSGASLKRSHPSSVAAKEKEKENAAKAKKGNGTLDAWFSGAKAAASKKKEEVEGGGGEKPPPKKKARKSIVVEEEVEEAKKGLKEKGKEKGRERVNSGGSAKSGRERELKKATGVLKGRPILQDLVSSES